MILEDFIRFLDDKGINYRQKDDKLILAECPECGSFKYKVALFTDRIEEEGKLIGKCIKCDAPYTSFSYLLKLGFDIQEVKTLHKYAAVPMVNDDGYATLDLELNREIVKELYVPQVISLASFFKMSEWLDHPASQYSIKRGIPTELYDQIMIDPVLGAVVFVCYEDGKPVGFQRRLLHPFDPAQKTLSSEGWQKTQHILRFPNKGNLLVCEGPFTAVSGYRFGYDSICTFGAGVSNRQLELILDLAVDTGKSIGVA